MKKRKIVTKRNLKNFSSCKALILVESDHLKAAERARCEELFHRLESARESIRAYESQDVPDYQKWLDSHFSEIIAKIKEFDRKLFELEHIVESVQMHSIMTGCSEQKAYQILMGLKEKVIQKTEENPEDEEEAREEAKKEFEDILFRSMFESFFGKKQKNYEKEFEKFKKRMQDQVQNENRSYSHNKKKSSEKKTSFNSLHSQIQQKNKMNIKEQYHFLARKLHPDMNPSPKISALWHQIQEAYKMQDLARLETLGALIEMHEQGWNKIERLSTLKNLFAELKAELCKVEKKIRSAKKEYSWNFCKKKQVPQQIEQFKTKISREMQDNYMEVRFEFEKFQSIVDAWANPRKKGQKRKNSRISVEF